MFNAGTDCYSSANNGPNSDMGYDGAACTGKTLFVNGTLAQCNKKSSDTGKWLQCQADQKLASLQKKNGNCMIYETSGGDDKSWDPRGAGSATMVTSCCSKKSGGKPYWMAAARVTIKCGHKSTVYKLDQSFGPV